MDDLTRINGIGKATAKTLAAAGVTSFAELAGLNVDQGPAKELGLKATWIAEAMSFVTEASQDTKGSSGTAREASGTGGGTAAVTPNVGAQPGSPHISADTPSLKTADGGSGGPAAPAADFSAWRGDVGMDEARKRWPLTIAAITAWDDGNVGPADREPLLRIAARREGFRRAGIAHSKAPTEHPISSFTPDQVEQLLAEPNLVVEIL